MVNRINKRMRVLGGNIMRKIIIMIIIGLIGLLFVCSCAKDMEAFEKGDIKASKKVLIAGTDSEFKQNVVNKVIETLGTEDYYFKIIGLEQLDKEETEPYGAILLINSFMAGKMDKRVTQFLQNDPDNPKVIVFYTIGSEGTPPSGEGKPDIEVDAVTSASLPDRIDERVDQLVTLIEERF